MGFLFIKRQKNMTNQRLLLIFFSFFTLNIFSQTTSFVTEWLTNDGQIIIPTNPLSGSYNYNIKVFEKNDSVNTVQLISNLTENDTITGLSTDTIVVEITGVFPHFYMNNELSNKSKLIRIVQWGNLIWTSFENAFYGCNQLQNFAFDIPNLSQTTSMAAAFADATLFNGDLFNWNVSSITDMRRLFHGASNFNCDLSNWNISSVSDMEAIFTLSGMSYCNMDTTLNAWFPILNASTFNLGQIPEHSNMSQATVTSLGLRIAVANVVSAGSIGQVSLSRTPEHCQGKMITISANSSDAQSNFQWSDGSRGNSNIFVLQQDTTLPVIGFDINNCRSYDTIFIQVDPSPTTNLTLSQAACIGSNITVVANGADTYTWEDLSSANNTSIMLETDTILIVEGTNSFGCSVSDTLQIEVLPTPVVQIFTANNNTMVCPGDTVNIYAIGANTYLWNTSETMAGIYVINAVQTTYSVVGTDTNGCSSSADITLDVYTLPLVQITASETIVCKGKTVTLIAEGQNLVSYNWSTGNNTQSITVNPYEETTYIVVVEDENGCVNKVSKTIEVKECVSIDENEISFSVFPNPTNDMVTIQTQNLNWDKAIISLLDMTGKILLQENLTEENTVISLANYPSGIYLIKINSGRLQHIQKVVKY